MAKEPDQTKWVGVRPTDPSENIPVTTRKFAPAIGDLQAIKEAYGHSAPGLGVDTSMLLLAICEAAGAGEIWVVTNASIINEVSFCDMQILARIGGVNRVLKAFYSVPAKVEMCWDGLIALEEGDAIYGQWKLGGANDDVRTNAQGYKIGVY